MSDNPFQAPMTEEFAPAVGVRSGQHRDVRSVAVYQKGILVCLLLYLLALVGQFVVAVVPVLVFVLLPGIFCVWLAGFVFVILLAMKVYSPGLGAFLGILTLVPLLNLLILLMVNGKATSILRANGHRVGLMGAKLAEIPA